MNKTAIKNFAVWARRKLISEITYKAGLLGVTEKGAAEPLPQSTRDLQFFDIGTKNYVKVQGTEIPQRNALVAHIRNKACEVDYKTAFQNVVEEIAYTWFNRMIAIRFMEINDYLPSHIRVLSSEQPGKLEPDFVTAPFDTDLDFTPDERDRVLQLKDENKLDELFRMLFIKQCNKLHEILPELFEETDNYTELLLTISFTDKDGVIYHLTHDIPESDFDISHTDDDGKAPGQVEILGWMYQYYNTEPKDEVFALLKKNVKITKERIPAATQLFTPDWIVRYMVENSLGRLWVEGHPNDALKAGWKYYLEEAAQEPEVQAQLAQIRADYSKLNPEDIKVIDPCMGSGHILVYAFDVLMQIYEAQGYTQRDAARLIVEKNLYGLDIDNRAYQLSYFAVMMKARQYNRRILSSGVKPNLYVTNDGAVLTPDMIDYIANGSQKLRAALQSIAHDLTNAREYGSIIDVTPVDFDALFARFAEIRDGADQDLVGLAKRELALHKVLPLVEQARVMAQKYDVVCTNPPYMGSSGMGSALSNYVKTHYPDSKSDLFAVFMERCEQLVKKNGYQAMITQHAWMFLSSFEKLRRKLLIKSMISSIVHLGMEAFEDVIGKVVSTVAFVFREAKVNGYVYPAIRLVDFYDSHRKKKEVCFFDDKYHYCSNQNDLSKIPGIPLVYWLCEPLKKAFSNTKLGEITHARRGLETGNNELLLRIWYEVSAQKFCSTLESTHECQEKGVTWVPHNKGGEYRKWYGNNNLVVNFYNDGQAIRKSGVLNGYDCYFKEGITWTALTNIPNTFRFSPHGHLFDSNKGPMLFSEDKGFLLFLLGFLNSIVAQQYISALNPTLSLQNGDVDKLPIIYSSNDSLTELVKKNIDICRADWDSFETSWDFKRNPLV